MGIQSLLLLGVKPENELENVLLSFLKGKSDIGLFLDALVSSQVFVLIKGDGSVPSSAGISPLVMDGQDGNPAVCIFTSPVRSKGIQRRVPAYATGLQIDFRAFVSSIPPGLGLIVNAGTFFSTEATWQGVDELRAS